MLFKKRTKQKQATKLNINKKMNNQYPSKTKHNVSFAFFNASSSSEDSRTLFRSKLIWIIVWAFWMSSFLNTPPFRDLAISSLASLSASSTFLIESLIYSMSLFIIDIVLPFSTCFSEKAFSCSFCNRLLFSFSLSSLLTWRYCWYLADEVLTDFSNSVVTLNFDSPPSKQSWSLISMSDTNVSSWMALPWTDNMYLLMENPLSRTTFPWLIERTALANENSW